MSDNQRRILDMLAEKKISVDEAQRLLSLIEPGEEAETKKPRDASRKKSDAKYFRVVVEPKEGTGAEVERVNIRVPIRLIRAGIKLTSLIPAHASGQVNEALREKGIDFDLRNLKTEDLEELIDALSDLEVDVQNGREKVRVYME